MQRANLSIRTACDVKIIVFKKITCEACWGRWWKDSMNVRWIGLITYNVPIHQLNYITYPPPSTSPLQLIHTHPISSSIYGPFPLLVITAQPARWPCCQSPEASSHLVVRGGWKRLQYAAVRTSHLEEWGNRVTWTPSWSQRAPRVSYWTITTLCSSEFLLNKYISLESLYQKTSMCIPFMRKARPTVAGACGLAVWLVNPQSPRVLLSSSIWSSWKSENETI